MRPRQLSWIAETVGGTLLGDDCVATGAQFDSRLIRPGHLFVAIKDWRADGHLYVEDAVARGASGAMVSRNGPGRGSRIVVPIGWRALAELAAAERRDVHVPVVAVTGSTGKTTTKDLIGAMSPDGKFAVSPRSFNNVIGVSLTVLGAGPATDAIVCELGTHRTGDMRWLLHPSQPTIGVVTNIGLAHIGPLRGWRGLVAEKRALVSALPRGGTAILNADDPVVRSFQSDTAATPLLYGFSRAADVRGEIVDVDPECRVSLVVRTPKGEAVVRAPIPGRHTAWNILAAIACGTVLGVPVAASAEAVARARITSHRLEVFDSPLGFRVIDDAFSASPASMTAALGTAAWIARGRRLITTVSGMYELGPLTVSEHQRIGALVSSLGVDHLITLGRRGRLIGDAAVQAGMRRDSVTACDSAEDALASVAAVARPGDVVLIKGYGKMMGLDRVAEALRQGSDELAS